MVGDKSGLFRERTGRRGFCDHEYVKESPSGSFAIHVTLTVAPSLTVWSDPTLTVGLMLSVVTSSMVRTIVSWYTESVPSSTVRVRVIVVLAVTEDAVTVGVAELELSKDNLESCDHEYVRSLSLSSSEPDPCNVMEPPSSTCLSLPASALGAWLTSGAHPVWSGPSCPWYGRCHHQRAG